MKKVKVLILITLLASMSVCYFFGGCTGGGIYDPITTPTITPTTTPTTVPTLTYSPTHRVTNFSQGQANIFNLALWGNSTFIPPTLVRVVDSVQYYIGEMVFWTEASTSPLGRVFERSRNHTSTAPQVLRTAVTGLNLPRVILLERSTTDAADPSKNTDFIYVSESGTQIGSNLRKYLRHAQTGAVTQVTRLFNDRPGHIWYATFDHPYSPQFIYYGLDTGGVNSNLERIRTNLTAPGNPDVLAVNLPGIHSVYVFNHFVPGVLSRRFLFATQKQSAPNGRVLMFDITNWNGTTQLTPIEIAVNQNHPSKMTFVPDIQPYVVPGGTIYAHSLQIAGYLYWVNWSPSTGQVVRVRLSTNAQGQLVVSTPQVVAQSLEFPYDIIGPDDIRPVFVTGRVTGSQVVVEGKTSGEFYSTWNSYNQMAAPNNAMFQTLYVSSNRDRAQGGDWYEIDLTRFNGTTAMVPGTGLNNVRNYLPARTTFPLNGQMQFLMLTDPVTGIGRVFKRDLYFTIFNYEAATTGNSGVMQSEEVFLPVAP
jgi:hypothetical protein